VAVTSEVVPFGMSVNSWDRLLVTLSYDEMMRFLLQLAEVEMCRTIDVMAKL
jgi:hypothetical protein